MSKTIDPFDDEPARDCRVCSQSFLCQMCMRQRWMETRKRLLQAQSLVCKLLAASQKVEGT